MPVKHASNDLRRLYRMGFLKRTRVKRRLAHDGRLYNRGFEYKYHLSKQGLKHVEWLKKGKIVEDLAYTKLTREVLSYLPDELKDRLAMLSLWRSSRKSVGPRRTLNLLENNTVPVIVLSTQNVSLKSENQRLELLSATYEGILARLLGNALNVQEENKSLYTLLAWALVLGATHMNSAEYWRGQFKHVSNGSAADPPLFESHPRSSGAKIAIPCIVPWSKYLGKTAFWQETDGSRRIQDTFKVTPEYARTLTESI